MTQLSRIARVHCDGEACFVRVDPGQPAQRLSAAPWLGGVPVAALEATPGSPQAPFLCPVTPSKILGIGRNYADHARELGNALPSSPLVFLKPPSSLLEPGGVVELPAESARVDFEGELAVVVGRRLRRCSLEEAAAGVFGLCVACDVTARDWQKSDGQWARAKGADTFCPVGPWVTVGGEPSGRRVLLSQNGTTRQDGTTDDLIFAVPTLIAHLSQSMTLEPGDLLLTGTPAGVGPLADGDVVTVQVEGVGTLSFSVTGGPRQESAR